MTRDFQTIRDALGRYHQSQWASLFLAVAVIIAGIYAIPHLIEASTFPLPGPVTYPVAMMGRPEYVSADRVETGSFKFLKSLEELEHLVSPEQSVEVIYQNGYFNPGVLAGRPYVEYWVPRADGLSWL